MTNPEHKCRGCGEECDLPWGFCSDCTAALLDAGRKPEFRLNPPDVLEEQFAKIRAYADANT